MVGRVLRLLGVYGDKKYNMKTQNWFNYSSLLILFTFPVQATEPLWITENTSANEITAALTLPSNPDEVYRYIVDIVDKHPKVAVQINFAYDSSKLNKTAKTLLGKLGRVFIGKLSNAVFILAGHTDSKGSETYNLGLSLRRASSVQSYFINKYRISETRLILKAYGEDKPIATNITAEGRTKNRRVEFIRVR